MTKDQERYIIKNFDIMSVEKLRVAFNNKFGTSYKVTAFHYHTDRLGLRKHVQHEYTALEDEFLKINSNLMTRQELTDAFNKEFECSIKTNAIEQRCFKKGFKPLDDGKFKQGNVPWQKTPGGRDAYVKSLIGGNSRSFRKGHIPANVKTIGTESIRSDGYTYIKTKFGWITKQKAIYEKKYGKISTDLKVIPVDGDKNNLSIDNLRAVDNYVITVLMANDWIDKGPDIFDAGVKYAELKRALKREEKINVGLK